MSSKAVELGKRSRATRAPQPQTASPPQRPEVPSGGGGVMYVVLRSWAPSSMRAQKLKYTDPRDPIAGEIEAVGPEVVVYPPEGFSYAAFEPFVYATDDEDTYPLGRRVWPLRAQRIDGLWFVEPAFKSNPGLEFIDPTAEISGNSGG